ncbi:hypothetical protein LLEC1_07984 [Akanthomyces lecanii]|uniref:Protein kinase domain-containing protein n=1 Tax=Cordyceps confragosa TaxID=2714763 RepID=A0A179IEE5_CORDF|nr:hypothetical protein LLEC1_07984 [Akanthomyces lecanii]
MAAHPEANAKLTIKAVRNLARILAEVDPSTFGLLQCRGVVKIEGAQDANTLFPPTPNFKFVFSIPLGLSKPRSLREILLSSARFSLDERLELAKKPVNSVLFVHTARFVHKNIRPETVIVFQNENSPIGAPFLVGFQQFRVEDGGTYRMGDGVWEHNLYRHPSRQGIHPEVDYEMQHDIYSLGVLLLEIGLWTSFVLYSKSDASCQPQRNDIIGSLNLSGRPHTCKIAYKNKQVLEEFAERELAPQLGKRYTNIVLQCLRCSDTGLSGNFNQPCSPVGGIGWADEDGVTVGARYIENVIEGMQAISL